MNQLNREKRVQIVSSLVEGSSINTIVRMTGVSKVTILKLMGTLGPACALYQDKNISRRNPI
jgi:transposase